MPSNTSEAPAVETPENEEEIRVEEEANQASVAFGAVRVVLDGTLSLPPEAGTLSPVAVKRVPRAPKGLGLASENAADSLEKAMKLGFVPPPDVTPEALRDAGAQAERIDSYIGDMEVVLNTLKQGNLLLDAKSYELLRKLNDQVKAQGKFAPEIARAFEGLTGFFERPGRPPKK